MAGGGLGFGSGFAQGFAGALTGKRQRERDAADKEAARRDRLFGALLPTMIENAEDWSDVEAAIIAQYPEMAGGKGKQKGDSPLSKVGKFLAPFLGLKGKRNPMDVGPADGQTIGTTFGGGTLRMGRGGGGRMPPSNQPPGVTGGTLDSVMARARGGAPPTPPTAPLDQPPPQASFPPAIDMPPGDAPFGMLPGDQIASPRFPAPTRPTGDVLQTTQSQAPGQGQPAAASAGQTLFGVRMMTPEQKAERQILLQSRMATQQLEASVAARQSLAQRMGLTPEQTTAFALEGRLPTGTTATGFTLNPGDVRFDASGKPVASVPAAASTASQQINTLEEALVQAQASGDARKVQAVLDLQKRSADAKRAPADAAGGQDMTDLAAMVADNPAMLQGVTPTVASGVMQTLAKSPALRARYETSRMEPIRAQTQEILNTMQQLVQVDATTGKVLGLTDGAKTLYGKSQYLGTQFLPGSDAANARAALAQVTGQLALDTIKTMKEQSRTGATGFGQMNLRELALLEQAASILKGNISEELALEKLTDLFDKYQKILLPSAQESVDARRLAAGGGAGAGAGTGAGAPRPAAGGGTGMLMDAQGNIVAPDGTILIPAN